MTNETYLVLAICLPGLYILANSFLRYFWHNWLACWFTHPNKPAGLYKPSAPSRVTGPPVAGGGGDTG